MGRRRFDRAFKLEAVKLARERGARRGPPRLRTKLAPTHSAPSPASEAFLLGSRRPASSNSGMHITRSIVNDRAAGPQAQVGGPAPILGAQRNFVLTTSACPQATHR